MHPTKFQVNWPFASEEELKNGFSRWRPWRPPWISDRNNFHCFWPTSRPDASKFQVNWPFGSGEEAKTRLSSWRPCWPSWISARNNFFFSLYDLQVTPMLPIKFQVNWPFGSREEVKNSFQDGGHGGHLGISTWTILVIIFLFVAIFDLYISLMLLTKFQVNWPFCSGEEVK